MAALERGDHDRVLSILMRAHGESLYRYCRRMVGESLADDVHQVTFVHAYRALGRFRGDSSLRSWLYGIARHRCLDALRKERRRAPGATEPPELAAPGSGVDQRLAARRVLEHCLGKLDARVRDAVLLRYQQGLSYREMAEACGEEPAALQMRVARALPRLRRCIESRSQR